MSEAHKPDIIDFRLNHTMSITAFQHVIELLAAQDIHLVHQIISTKACTGCKCNRLVDLQYGLSAKDVSYEYSICLNCWEIGFWIPIYEGEGWTDD